MRRRPSARAFNLWALLLTAISILAMLAAYSVRGADPAPTPTPTPTLTQAAQDLLFRVANAITTPIVNTLGSHPVAMLFGMLFLAIAIGVTNGVRRAWPVKRLPTDQPRWAAFLLGFFDPFVGNFWNISGWLGKKTHVPVYIPTPEEPPREEKTGEGGP